MAETLQADEQQNNHEMAARDYCFRLAQEIKAYPRRRVRRSRPQQEALPENESVGKREPALIGEEEKQTNLARAVLMAEVWIRETKSARTASSPIAEMEVAEIETILHRKPHLQATMASLIEYPPSEWLLEQELAARGDWPPIKTLRELDETRPSERIAWESIDLLRREMIALDEWTDADGNPDVYLVAERLGRTGLCFSGGGIRSATFNLGVLEGLAKLDRLNRFDLLSTVSGGGYIHQFLAAWLTRNGLMHVQKDLEPLPGPPSTRIFWPEPLRWLRRYSNYLTPQVGLFTADTWVAFSIWLRNTFLNQIVLISTLMLLLALPHFQLSHSGSVAQFLLTEGRWTAVAVIACFLLASSVIIWQVGTPSPTLPANQLDPQGLLQSQVLASVLLPILVASFLVSPYLYRSAFWMGDHRSINTTLPCWASAIEDSFNDQLAPASSQLYLLELHSLSKTSAWKKESEGSCSFDLSAAKTGRSLINRNGLSDFNTWSSIYSVHWWEPAERIHTDTQSALVFFSLLFGIALVVLASWSAFGSGSGRLIFMIAIPGAWLATYFMIGVARWLLFTISFFLRVDLVTRMNIVILPPIVVGIIFIAIELAGGLIGNLVDESVREWFARLRAWSFLFCFVWLSWIGLSLLGPSVVDHLLSARHPHLGTSAILGWIGTTIASVLAGKSPSTSGTSGDNKSLFSRLLNILALLGPPVFVIGLSLILCDIIERILDVMARSAPHTLCDHAEYYLLLGILALIAILFGWRIDINEFSLHAFYRDRLARCYAGATTPNRRPNWFTGFAAGDKTIRLTDLLPTVYSKTPNDLLRRDAKQIAVAPTYEGPFPIFCTTINLSFGEDMAYQERKGAAFAFTPLYCGYDVGWTEADSNRVQFNGFTPTRDFAYDGGPRMATAVATSGAAISPNWGFHTSPTMAFLLTIFNVRLGLWIRNPRHKRFWQEWTHPNKNPSSPVFGLFYLLRELIGMVNDAAPFVYLTDGGHFENMGLYELVRRHVMRIVICDAEEDGGHTFEGIGMAIRKCRIDFGAEITLDITKLEPAAGTSLATTHSVQGTIRYPSGAEGQILYIKTAFTAALPADIINYHKEHPAFPNDTTANQWFTESQFESYRRIGLESAVTGVASGWLASLYTPPVGAAVTKMSFS